MLRIPTPVRFDEPKRYWSSPRLKPGVRIIDGWQDDTAAYEKWLDHVSDAVVVRSGTLPPSVEVDGVTVYLKLTSYGVTGKLANGKVVLRRQLKFNPRTGKGLAEFNPLTAQ